ncbi:MAG: AroM family protein [Candidatus Bathyarchaeia archaeon]
MKKVGVLTIGQSPRPDITSDFTQHLSAKVILVEAGVLNGLSNEYVKEKMRPNIGDVTYVSRLRDGTQVKLAKNKIIPLMQKRISQLEEEGVDFIVIFCTGDFPKFDARVPVVYAGEVLKGFFSGFKCERNVGILVPLEEQIDYAHEKWKAYFKNLVVLNASPYTSTEEDFRKVAEKFRESSAELIIMDCMGYTFNQKRIVKEYANVPVVSSRSALIKFLDELLT